MSPDAKELEPGLAHLAGEVQQAEAAILKTLEDRPNHKWNPRNLQEEATNGWSASVVSIAFWRLVSSERLEVDEHLRVHLTIATAA